MRSWWRNERTEAQERLIRFAENPKIPNLEVDDDEDSDLLPSLMSAGEAAEYLGVVQQHISFLIREGLPVKKKLGSGRKAMLLFSRDDLDWFKANRGSFGRQPARHRDIDHGYTGKD